MESSQSRLERHQGIAHAASIVAALVAVGLIAWAVGMAGATLEPWGDSSKAFYALVGDVLLGMGTLLLSFAVGMSRPAIVAWPLSKRLELIVYIVGAVALAIPLAVSSANSLEASFGGRGHPSPLVVVLGGIGLSSVLALLMRRRPRLGVFASVTLGGSLMVYALQFPH